MEANVWFYTFSTAAQVVAALVGLFAVFVVYKIQEFSETLSLSRRNAINVISYISVNTKNYKGVSRQDLLNMGDAEMIKIFGELLEIQKLEPQRVTVMDSGFDKEEYNLFERLFSLRNKIFSKLKEGMILGLDIIGISLISLATTQLVLPHFYMSIVIMVLFLVILIIFLAGVGKNIFDITTKS